MYNPDETDIRLLNALQSGLPVSVTPFRELGRSLRMNEEETIKRLNNLKEHGYIRRIGAVLDSRRMGFYSTLCACRIGSGKLEEAAVMINKEPGVTHNYIRDHEYNLWFTLTAESETAAGIIIENLRKKADIDIVAMPAEKVYKIKVILEVSGGDDLQ
ncbi:MAG: AsnC family transcriptional regulator [Syntrophomonadaceae bacterium]|nr:AsnC family transcriptional regulator [Syntrophomonadaceae bacterium]